MSEVVISCAGCGKRYKGVSGAKKYKCNQCSNLFSFPDSTRTPCEGTLLCSCCWTGVAVTEALSDCLVCEQKISFEHGGRATLTSMPSEANVKYPPEESNGTRPISRHAVQVVAVSPVPASAMIPNSTQQAEECKSMEAKINELQARLNLWQESQAMALRERDEAGKARQRFETQAAEMQARLLNSQENHSKQALELTLVSESRRALEAQVSDLMSRVTAMQETLNALQKERDAAVQARQVSEERAVRAESQLTPLQQELQRAHEERKQALTERSEFDARSRELAVRVESLQGALTGLRSERDDERRRADDERARLIEARLRLTQFQDIAAAALRPLADQHERISRSLSAEIEGMLEQAHAAQKEYQQRRARLGALEGEMLEQLTSVAREAERILTSASASGAQLTPADPAESTDAAEPCASNMLEAAQVEAESEQLPAAGE